MRAEKTEKKKKRRRNMDRQEPSRIHRKRVGK
jgi:hypothetical protein